MSEPNKLRTVGSWMSLHPHTIGDDQMLDTARERMLSLGIRHLGVLHGGHLVGIVSDRDITLVESVPGVDIGEVAVSEGMSEEPWTVSPDAELAEVARTMAERRLGAALVVDKAGGDVLVGVFTTIDALRALAEFSVEFAS